MSEYYDKNYFIENKYSRTYFKIIDRAKSRTKDDEYYEKHHIVPKSIGGTDDQDNIAILTAREHFICHLLLPKFTQGENSYKMLCAVNKMLCAKEDQSRYLPSSRLYEIIRKEFSNAHSIYMTGRFVGDKHHSFGKIRSVEYREKISKALVGRIPAKMQCEHCLKEISAGPFKKYHGDRCTENKNISLSDLESRKKTKKKVCPYCNKEAEVGSYGRWHGDKCKHSKEYKNGKN